MLITAERDGYMEQTHDGASMAKNLLRKTVSMFAEQGDSPGSNWRGTLNIRLKAGLRTIWSSSPTIHTLIGASDETQQIVEQPFLEAR